MFDTLPLLVGLLVAVESKSLAGKREAIVIDQRLPLLRFGLRVENYLGMPEGLFPTQPTPQLLWPAPRPEGGAVRPRRSTTPSLPTQIDDWATWDILTKVGGVPALPAYRPWLDRGGALIDLTQPKAP